MKANRIQLTGEYIKDFNQLLYKIKNKYKNQKDQSIVCRVPIEFHDLFMTLGNNNLKEGMKKALLLSNVFCYEHKCFNVEEWLQGKFKDIGNDIALFYGNNHSKHYPELEEVFLTFLSTGRVNSKQRKGGGNVGADDVIEKQDE